MQLDIFGIKWGATHRAYGFEIRCLQDRFYGQVPGESFFSQISRTERIFRSLIEVKQAATVLQTALSEYE